MTLPPTEGAWRELRKADGRLVAWLEVFEVRERHAWVSIPGKSRVIEPTSDGLRIIAGDDQ
jgi:hypothetical protein